MHTICEGSALLVHAFIFLLFHFFFLSSGDVVMANEHHSSRNVNQFLEFDEDNNIQ